MLNELLLVRSSSVSMKSGLEGRNNWYSELEKGKRMSLVSMKSGLEGRNNGAPRPPGRR